MLTVSNLKRRLVTGIGLALAVVQLMSSVAVACEGGGEEEETKGNWLTVKNVSGMGEAPEGGGGNCAFTTKGEGCKIEFINNTFIPLEVVGGELTGTEKANYEKGVIGCTVLLPLASKGDSCIDQVKLKTVVHKTFADYCMKVKSKTTGRENSTCAALFTK
jgi:hypothetical protein